MKIDVQSQANEYIKAHQKKKRRYSVLMCLASVVVFCTTYALILPAITMENESCNIPEHLHTEECYSQVTVTTEKSLICTEDTTEGHVHTDACYETVEVPVDAEALTCKIQEGDGHHHNALCYGTWKLICDKTEHIHTEACHVTEEETGTEQEIQDENLLNEDEEANKEVNTDEQADNNTDIEQDYLTIAEAAEGSNWIQLRDSGWFDAYNGYAVNSSASNLPLKKLSKNNNNYNLKESDSSESSEIQVNERGGTNTSDDGSVSVSKTISGTELENVFDITLQVQTSESVGEITAEPDMAVVIVMDISNTMNSDFGGVTRYAAAMTAAESFLGQFADNNSLGISKVGYVAFNTDAHEIFGLQPCTNTEQVNDLKNTMRTETGAIINASDYNSSHSRFTNVEAGLAMASDMLNSVSNKNKYIIFLSDGFPTTYIRSGYSGYDPYDSTERFYDRVLNKPCLYGTSYSDEAAIRARNKAASIKNSGTKIFSIGVDVAGQTIQKYITQSENASGFSVVDRTGTTYEIGDASSTEAYKSWLRNSIGSGYYYDSTDSEGLNNAYTHIFNEIKQQIGTSNVADWVATDPLPVGASHGTVEFIGFYNINNELVKGDLTGEYVEGGEDTANYDESTVSISWDLKNSGYHITTSEGNTTYTYSLIYRVRLKNEDGVFVENTVYPTNDTTTLQYRRIENKSGQISVTDPKTVNFPIPSVVGYLGELTFSKVDGCGRPLSGAEFTLSHDKVNCPICRGDKTCVEIGDMIAVSDGTGQVSFTGVPSGHKYSLTETKVPEGYSKNNNTYQVEVAYDVVTVTVTDYGGSSLEWNGKIENHEYYALPETGGPGTDMYIIGGMLLITGAGTLMIYKRKKRRREGASP